MALTTCPDCNESVSDEAPACPKCGRPNQATTIQATGKYWKGLQLGGTLAMFAGIASCVALTSAPDHMAYTLDTAGTWSTLLGFCAIMAGKLGAFWYHG